MKSRRSPNSDSSSASATSTIGTTRAFKLSTITSRASSISAAPRFGMNAAPSRKQGIDVKVLAGEEIPDSLFAPMYRLYLSTIEKLYWGRQYLTPEFFELMRTDFKRNVALELAYKGRELVAGSFCLEKLASSTAAIGDASRISSSCTSTSATTRESSIASSAD